MAKRVLLTGANGFVGAHVLEQLLSHGLSVRSIVRSESKAASVQADFQSYFSSGKLDFGIVPDITVPRAFDSVVKSDTPFDIVIHTASPFLYRAVSGNQEFLDPAIKGTLEILKSVKEHASSVKRVVITGSCAAVVDFKADPVASPRKVYTESDWNPVTWEGALTGTANNAYQASKKFAEKAAWEFMQNEKPHFDLVTICPPLIYGPLRHSIKSIKDLNESNGRIYNLFVNSSKDTDLPPNGMHVYTDVREVATAHYQAAILPEAAGQRFIVSAGQVSSQQISDILRKNISELRERTPMGVPGGNEMDPNSYTCSGEKAVKVLGVSMRSMQETFVDLARQLLEIEEAEKRA